MSADTSRSDFPGSSLVSAGDTEGAVRAARDRLAEDVSSLRTDMSKMYDILSQFASEAGGQAARTARNVGQTVASKIERCQVGHA